MSDMNFFKYIEVIEAETATSLASKLRYIKVVYQLNSVWSDGTKHYALINAKKRLSVNTLEELAKIN